LFTHLPIAALQLWWWKKQRLLVIASTMFVVYISVLAGFISLMSMTGVWL
jgi:hypothetical protein